VLQDGGDPADMDSSVVLIDPVSMTRLASVRLCPAAHGIAVAPDGLTAYVSCLDDSLVVVDLVSPEHPTTKIPVLSTPGTVTSPLCYPYALTISPSGDSVWVSCFQSGDVLRFDTVSRTMDDARLAHLPGPAVFGTFSRDGAILLVPHQLVDGIAFVEAATGAILDDVLFTDDVCLAPHAVKLTEDEARLMVVCEGNHTDPGTLVVFDLASHAVERIVTLGRFPDDLTILRPPT
jgi:hypothetical protein